MTEVAVNRTEAPSAERMLAIARRYLPEKATRGFVGGDYHPARTHSHALTGDRGLAVAQRGSP
jgi:hypothetical protein